MKIPANIELIPGVMQDHKGRDYCLGRYPSGKLVRIDLPPTPLLPRTQAEIASITVASKSLLPMPDMPEIVRIKLKRGLLYSEGQKYTTSTYLYEKTI